MTFDEPFDAHASTEPGGFCDAHRERSPSLYGLASVSRYGESRLWRVSGSAPVKVFRFHIGTLRVRRDVHDLVLPGTLLRLDSIALSWHCDGQTHETTARRLCILEGPFAGRCLTAWDTFLDDHETHVADPVEPLPVN